MGTQPSLFSNSTLLPSTDPKPGAVQAALPTPSPAARTHQPLCEYFLFPGCICIVTAIQAALACEAQDLSWGCQSQYPPLPWTSDRSSLPASLQAVPGAKPDSPWLHANHTTFMLLLQK